MRDKKRIKRILKKIELLWNEYPDQRFGQLLFNYTPIGQRTHIGCVRDPFHYDDEGFEAALDGMLDAIVKENIKKEKEMFRKVRTNKINIKG